MVTKIVLNLRCALIMYNIYVLPFLFFMSLFDSVGYIVKGFKVLARDYIEKRRII